MRNLRTIKKDLDFIVGELIDDTLIYLELSGGKNEDKVAEIIDAALDFEDEMIDKINHRPADQPAKKYYKAIEKEILEGIDKLYDELSKLPKK